MAKKAKRPGRHSRRAPARRSRPSPPPAASTPAPPTARSPSEPPALPPLQPGEVPRILCVTGVCNYDHLRLLLHYVKGAMERAGASTRVLDLARGAPGPAQWQSIRSFAPHVAFSWNAMGAELVDPSGHALPMATWMVDEPYYHPHWAELLRRPGLRTFWSTDVTCEQARRMGASHPEPLLVATRVLPRCRPEDRDIDVLFAGSAAHPEAMRAAWTERFGPTVAKVIGVLVEEWGADPSQKSLPATFEALCKTLGLEQHPGIMRLTPLLLGEANRFVRARDRLAVLRAFADRPGVVVYGDGWEQLVPSQRIEFRPSVPFSLFEEAVVRSRVTLAAQPVHGFGPSERYFMSMANESALVVNDNDWLRANYAERDEYLAYPLRTPSLARAHVDALLADESKRAAQVSAARARTLASHTWDARVAVLFEKLGLSRAKQAA